MFTIFPKRRTHTEIPVLKGHPLVGVLPRFRRDALATLLDAVREHGDAVRIDLGPQRITLLSNPDHVRHVLQQNPGNYVKGYDKLRALLGNGLVLNEGESWLKQRRLMQPAFHRKRIARFAEVVTSETEEMLGRWDTRPPAGPPIDVAREMTLLTQGIIVKTMFGSDVGSEGEKIARAFDVALSGINLRFLLPLWFGRLPIPANRRFERALATLDEAVHRIIRERRRETQGEADDLLSMLMEARDEETGEGMSDRQLRDEVMTVYLAGHETTAMALSWLWYLLSKNPESARKVREEVVDVAGDSALGVDDLPKLAYTKMVVDETFRLYPSAWLLSRKAIRDDQVGPYRIPAGSMLFLSPFVTHRRPDLWANPEGFDPERFAPGRDGAKPRYAYFPFGGGPRQCIGNNFALMEATLIVASVARRCRLDLVPGREVKVRERGSLVPYPGMPMMPRTVADQQEEGKGEESSWP